MEKNTQGERQQFGSPNYKSTVGVSLLHRKKHPKYTLSSPVWIS